MTRGSTTQGMIPVLMTTTHVPETRMVMTLTDAAYTVSGPHTVCTAPTVTTADGAALAHDHNR